jgi:hypothetical protein
VDRLDRPIHYIDNLFHGTLNTPMCLTVPTIREMVMEVFMRLGEIITGRTMEAPQQ